MKTMIGIFIPQIVSAIGEYSIVMHTGMNKFKLDFGFNLQNRANLFTISKHFVLLTNWVYHTTRLKMDELHRYYLIWEDIRMACFICLKPLPVRFCCTVKPVRIEPVWPLLCGKFMWTGNPKRWPENNCPCVSDIFR